MDPPKAWFFFVSCQTSPPTPRSLEISLSALSRNQDKWTSRCVGWWWAYGSLAVPRYTMGGVPRGWLSPNRCMTGWTATAVASSLSLQTPAWKSGCERSAGTRRSCGWCISWYVRGLAPARTPKNLQEPHGSDLRTGERGEWGPGGEPGCCS